MSDTGSGAGNRPVDEQLETNSILRLGPAFNKHVIPKLELLYAAKHVDPHSFKLEQDFFDGEQPVFRLSPVPGNVAAILSHLNDGNPKDAIAFERQGNSFLFPCKGLTAEQIESFGDAVMKRVTQLKGHEANWIENTKQEILRTKLAALFNQPSLRASVGDLLQGMSPDAAREHLIAGLDLSTLGRQIGRSVSIHYIDAVKSHGSKDSDNRQSGGADSKWTAAVASGTGRIEIP